MKKTILVLFLALIMTGCSSLEPKEVILPEPVGVLVDEADVISPAIENKIIDEIYKNFDNFEIAVVTVESLQGLSIEDYSIRLAEKWKVGEMGKDNGLIILVSEQDRKYRVEIGYGLEGKLNDSKAGSIMREFVVPFLKNNDYENGILTAVEKLSLELNK